MENALPGARAITRLRKLGYPAGLPAKPGRSVVQIYPLRARRRPRRVGVRSVVPYQNVTFLGHIVVVFLSKIPSVSHLLVFWLQNVGPRRFFSQEGCPLFVYFVFM